MINERSALLEKDQNVPRHVTERGIVDELTNLIFAGTDTTSNTLTYLFWDLANNPEWQLRLRQELRDAVDDTADLEYKTISELPVLEAVVQESLRLRPVSPGSLQRLTPESGGVINGIVVPPQVRLSTPLRISCEILNLIDF
jgi:cytochrome P450